MKKSTVTKKIRCNLVAFPRIRIFAIVVKNIGHFLVYICLVTLLLLTGTAHEFIHSFTGHEDTIDCTHKATSENADFNFENEHHHCSFLNFTFSVFDNSVPNFDCNLLFTENPIYNQYLISFLANAKTHTHPRGPPLI